MIYANIATSKENIKSLEYTIDNIYNQFSEINIYTDGHKITDKKINCHIANTPDDNGRFFFTDKVDGFYFTIDDNRIYPTNYVKQTISKLDTYTSVCYGGRNYRCLPMVEYETSKCNVLHTDVEQVKNIYVQFPDTGSMAFHTNDLKLKYERYTIPDITDVITGCLIKRQKKLILSLKHPKNFIQYRQRPMKSINPNNTAYVRKFYG